MARTVDPKLELLRSVPALRTHSDRELARVAPLVDEVRFRAGDVLMQEGRPGDEVFVIVAGTASVTLRGERVAALGPGDFAGEMALLDHSPRSATVTAATDVTALVLGPQDFGALLDRPAVGRRIAMELAARLRRAEQAPTYEVES